MFFGIIVRMYYAPKEHNPPHIHVYYQAETAEINIQSKEVMAGNLSNKQLRLVLAWLEIHEEDLMANWSLCQNGEKPFKIDPLK